MKIKPSELLGPALDWAVAEAIGKPVRISTGKRKYLICGRNITEGSATFAPHHRWDTAGPIIEREGILLRPVRKDGHPLHGQWLAMYNAGNTGSMVQWVKRQDWHQHYLCGPTPLIAAMRCFVASKLGDEVDVPDELLGG